MGLQIFTSVWTMDRISKWLMRHSKFDKQWRQCPIQSDGNVGIHEEHQRAINCYWTKQFL